MGVQLSSLFAFADAAAHTADLRLIGEMAGLAFGIFLLLLAIGRLLK